DGQNTCAEIAVHPSGKFLYASNRGAESVVLFEINEKDGTLTFVEEQNTGGKTPRHFGIDPSGQYMTIANQNSDNLLICRMESGNGPLNASGVFAAAASRACGVLLAPEKGGR